MCWLHLRCTLWWKPLDLDTKNTSGNIIDLPLFFEMICFLYKVSKTHCLWKQRDVLEASFLRLWAVVKQTCYHHGTALLLLWFPYLQDVVQPGLPYLARSSECQSAAGADSICSQPTIGWSSHIECFAGNSKLYSEKLIDSLSQQFSAFFF